MKLAATEIVSGVSGESEEKVRDIFTKAMVSLLNLSLTGFIYYIWDLTETMQGKLLIQCQNLPLKTALGGLK